MDTQALAKELLGLTASDKETKAARQNNPRLVADVARLIAALPAVIEQHEKAAKLEAGLKKLMAETGSSEAEVAKLLKKGKSKAIKPTHPIFARSKDDMAAFVKLVEDAVKKGATLNAACAEASKKFGVPPFSRASFRALKAKVA